MKKILFVLFMLVITANVFAADEFTIRDGIKFGMSEREILDIEKNPDVDRDREKISWNLTLDEIEVEDVREFGVRGDLHYFFMDDKMVMTLYDFDAEDIRYETLKAELEKKYGEASEADEKQIFIATDKLLGRKKEMWNLDNVQIILAQDWDDIDLAFLDPAAKW